MSSVVGSPQSLYGSADSRGTEGCTLVVMGLRDIEKRPPIESPRFGVPVGCPGNSDVGCTRRMILARGLPESGAAERGSGTGRRLLDESDGDGGSDRYGETRPQGTAGTGAASPSFTK